MDKESEKKQIESYDNKADDYAAFHNDRYSNEYYRKFVTLPITNNIPLQNSRIIEGMCGGGTQFTEYLVTKNVKLVALDISKKLLDKLKYKFPEVDIVDKSFLKHNFEANSYDAVFIIGGLHHVHPFVEETINKIHSLLKTNGYFCFMEPHSSSLFDLIRKFWYKFDKNFQDNEASIDIQRIKKDFSNKFITLSEKYLGSIGYLLIMQSGNLRIPFSIKKLYSPFLLMIESFLNIVNNRYISFYCIVQMQKK